jgi:hypothetical protein
VHHILKGVSVRAQDKRIKRGLAAAVDGVILVGFLVTSSSVSHEVDTGHKASGDFLAPQAAVILGIYCFVCTG